PLLLMRHVVTTRLATDFFDAGIDNYTFILWVYTVRSPWLGALQLIVLVVAWSHATIGLHFWLRVRPWYGRVRELALTIAVLVPVLALLGLFETGRHVTALAAADPGWAGTAFAGLPPPSEEEQRVLDRIGARRNVRLACQLRPNVPVEVTPLLPHFAHAADGARRVDLAEGSEREIAVLFADIRGFTALAEG